MSVITSFVARRREDELLRDFEEHWEIQRAVLREMGLSYEAMEPHRITAFLAWCACIEAGRERA